MEKKIRIISLILALSLLSVVCAQEEEKGAPPQEQQKIPTTIAEAHAELERQLSPETLAEIGAMPSEGDMIKYHFSLGLSI